MRSFALLQPKLTLKVCHFWYAFEGMLMTPSREVYTRLESQFLASYTHYAPESSSIIIQLQHLASNMGLVTFRTARLAPALHYE